MRKSHVIAHYNFYQKEERCVYMIEYNGATAHVLGEEHYLAPPGSGNTLGLEDLPQEDLKRNKLVESYQGS